MTHSLDADVTIAYVRELAQMWRKEETTALAVRDDFRFERLHAKAIVLEDLALQLEQQAVKVA